MRKGGGGAMEVSSEPAEPAMRSRVAKSAGSTPFCRPVWRGLVVMKDIASHGAES